MQNINVNDIKDKFGLKPKTTIPGDYITIEEILTGKYFTLFRNSDSVSKIINGLAVVNNEVVYKYAKINSIAIICDDKFPPCGKGFLVNTVASYDLYQRDLTGKEERINTGLSSIVNAIIKTSSPSFVYEKPYINGPENDTDYDIIFSATSVYYYGGNRYTSVKTLKQEKNRLSDYIPFKEKTHFITASLSKPVVSNKGDVLYLKVERMYDKIMHRIDMCGNSKDEKTETGLIEDVTTKALVLTDGKPWITIKNGIIKVKPQEFGAKERSSTITVSYMGNRATCVLTQKEGGKINNKYELSFDNGASTKFMDLETSLKNKFYIPVISKVNRYVDDDYKDTSNAYNLNVISDSNWINGRVIEINNEVNIELSANEENPSLENDREASIVISNKEDASKVITIIASQPAMSVVDESYEFEFVKEGTYTTEEFNNTKLYFIPRKKYTFENGSITYGCIEDEVSVGYDYKCDTNGMVSIYSIKQEGDKYYLLSTNSMHRCSKDVNCKIYGIIKDITGKEIFKTTPFSITIKGNDIISYQYELCFDGHNKYYEATWNNDSNVKTIPVKSVKHKVVNGIEREELPTPYIITCVDENNRPIADNSFSVKGLNNSILCYPYKLNKHTERKYSIIQKDTNAVISLKLTYKEKQLEKNVRLFVKMMRKGIKNNVWTGNDGLLLIDNKKIIKLKPCWLYPNATTDYDIAYDGIVTLGHGTHHFETFNVYAIDGISKTMTECNINKDIIIDNKTEKIDLIIEF